MILAQSSLVSLVEGACKEYLRPTSLRNDFVIHRRGAFERLFLLHHECLSLKVSEISEELAIL
jgi:hypothetical protein